MVVQLCDIYILLIWNQIHLLDTIASSISFLAFLVSSLISSVVQIERVEFKDIGGWSGEEMHL